MLDEQHRRHCYATTTSNSSASHPQSSPFPLVHVNEKTAYLSSDSQLAAPASSQQTLQYIIDEPGEPIFKYKGSAPSRGPHSGYAQKMGYGVAVIELCLRSCEGLLAEVWLAEVIEEQVPTAPC